MKLREIRNIRQREGEPKRRWFTSEKLDLILWQDEQDQLVGFQCCYDKPYRERALEWFINEGINHYDVDDGEQDSAGYKESPILISDGVPPITHIIEQFLEVSTELDPELKQSVLKQLNSTS